MNAPSGMNCERCRELLVELVCDELSAETAAEVRAHALRCERCGAELEKLQATLRASRELPLLSPPPEVEQRVMQAARDAIAGRARGPARELSSPPGTQGRFTAWFARLGSFAMSPQVAMASVLLLVVGIGLYALPLGQRNEPTALRATEDRADKEAAPAPSATATAAPLEREAAEQPEPEPPPPPEGSAMQQGAARERAARAERSAAAGGSAARAFPESKGVAEGARPAKAKSGKLGLSAGGSGAARDDFGSGAGMGKAASNANGERAAASAAMSPQKSMRKAAPESAAPGSFAPAPRAAPAAPAVADSAEAARASEAEAPAAKKREDGGALAQGIAAVQSGDHARAEALLVPLLSAGSPSERDQARLWLARSLRARGDCARALAYYRVLTQAVTAPRAVLEEAADCQERTGNAEAAAKLRARAAPK